MSVLKLDGAFVRGFQYESGEESGAAGDDGQPNPADEIIVEALVQLAHRLGLSVTAEGVETDAQASRLRPARLRHRAGVAVLPRGVAGTDRGTAGGGGLPSGLKEPEGPRCSDQACGSASVRGTRGRS